MRSICLLSLVLVMTPAFAGATDAPWPYWITGYWLSCENGRQTAEVWIDGGPGSMIVGVNLSGEPPKQAFEFMRMATVDGGLAFIASPGGALPTVFPLKSLDGQRAVFENLDHDFPQRVVYERQGDALKARIEGDINGEMQSSDWTFRLAALASVCPAD